ncbi:hypothetical protein [Rhizobium sp. BK251]|uniref:hypothetical protein n=1 Tax=Rhizobium sp. BK251 TaxID=2512125 RepID=UPI00104A36BC|nr:hypothetical protein [Rhizobium sp. BK251]TCL75051.1 hypothetical protein EV286_102617 [Rhizobium sp. BK251]
MDIREFLREGLVGVLEKLGHAFAGANWIALVVAFLVPILIISARNEIRNRRLRDIQDFITAYPATDQPQKGDAADRNPSLEFVVSKYTSSVRLSAKDYLRLSNASASKRIEEFIRSAYRFGSHGDGQIFIASIGLIILTYYGFSNLMAVLAAGFETPKVACPSGTSANACCAANVFYSKILIVGSLAFAGAFLAALGIFVRSLAVFDVSAYTVLRQSFEMLASILIVIFLFSAFADPTKPFETLIVGGPAARDPCAEISWVWLALAPVLGLLPQSSTRFLLVRMRSIVSWIKLDDDRFNGVTRIVPLDVIDGIDYWTRFRLEECGIADVQNLATYNPILLHIETPYTIYRSIDWVAQAQLCHIVGLDRFLLLRELNIKSIFDLERAIDYQTGKTSTNIGFSSPDEFDAILAGILFAPTRTMRDVGTISGVRPLIMKKDPATGATSWQPVDVDTYCVWARELISSDDKRTKICVEHIMSWISDDLHVRRLRRIWQEMSDSLGERSARLDNPATKTTVGDAAASTDSQGSGTRTPAKESSAKTSEEPVL